ncbi:MAG: hypothetical protein BIFFINMI_01846 [Phycisphaerae bacterium]|nr:hypothetical protein [Phycisphaerae bacterium]
MSGKDSKPRIGDNAAPAGLGQPTRQLAHRCPRDSHWLEHPLDAHLQAVGQLAADYAEAFGAADWGRLAGLWHDVGKYSQAFQSYLLRVTDGGAHLEGQPGRVDHSSAGAVQAIRRLADSNPAAARILAYVIAGHHAGLADWKTSSDASLFYRLAAEKSSTLDALARAPAELLGQAAPAMPALQPADAEAEIGFQAAFFTRMIFSCLADADFLDTEAFMDPARAVGRTVPAAIASMKDALRRHLEHMQARADRSPVNDRRREILSACLAAAAKAPGFFSLTVPTGGGKTLSSLAFALEHASRRGLERVVYAIPFTSIIEQNAAVFREALGELAGVSLIEHHCNLDPVRETAWNRLACENWDARLIVTTNVQFFESLLANRTSACRKLHNLARSVIIMDEAQSLPVELLAPCLAVLRELVRNYGCSVVLCTATQPAIHHREDFKIGLAGVREIVADPRQLYESMRRVRVEHAGKLDDGELIGCLSKADQVLCVVNTRKQAREVYAGLPDDGGSFHLSTLMCPVHRTHILQQVRRRLEEGLPCRLVSTQLIEAGVDIDFPVVYRAMAGLDSIAQAAGRCNREGRLDCGRVVAFDTDQPPPPGHLRQSAQTAGELIGLPGCQDLLGLEAIERYFRLYYWKRQDLWDKHQIMACFRQSNGLPISDFHEAARLFRFIKDDTTPIIIPWGHQGRSLVEELRGDPFPGRDLRRRLQRFTVQVRDRHIEWLQSRGALDPVHDQFHILNKENLYAGDTGLSLAGDMYELNTA